MKHYPDQDVADNRRSVRRRVRQRRSQRRRNGVRWTDGLEGNYGHE